MNPHPDQLLYSDPVDLPVDADLVTPCAAILDNGPANVCNRTAWIAEGGWASAMSWASGGATAHNLKRLAYADEDGSFFGVGDGGTNFLESSVDFGRSWTDRAAELLTGETLVDLAVSPPATGALSTVLLLTASRDVYTGLRTSFNTFAWTWTYHALSEAVAETGAPKNRFVEPFRQAASCNAAAGWRPAASTGVRHQLRTLGSAPAVTTW